MLLPRILSETVTSDRTNDRLRWPAQVVSPIGIEYFSLILFSNKTTVHSGCFRSVGRLRTECILFGLLPQLSFSVGKPEMSCTGNDVFGFGTTRCGDRNLLPYLIHRNVFSPRFRVGLRWTSVSPIATNCRLTEKCVHFQATKKKATRFYRIIYCVWTLSAKSGMT